MSVSLPDNPAASIRLTAVAEGTGRGWREVFCLVAKFVKVLPGTMYILDA
jgi:hypothetical protein